MIREEDGIPTRYSDARYLSSKKTVDDRALNKDVLQSLRLELGSIERDELRVLEVGAGLGTMAARLVEWGVIRRATYVLVDVDQEMLDSARKWLTGWAAARGFHVEDRSSSIRILDHRSIDVTVSLVAQELDRYLQLSTHTADLLVANAFLDLVDVPGILPRLLGLLAVEGVYWVSVNYDGDTIFCPEDERDEQFMRVYNRSMDERIRYGRPAGSSKTGRSLFRHFRAAGASIVAAGSSDWVVYGQNGEYEADERYFLHHIIHTIDEELKQHSEIDRDSLATWISSRHQQIYDGELVYIAHQLDFIGRPGRSAVPKETRA